MREAAAMPGVLVGSYLHIALHHQDKDQDKNQDVRDNYDLDQDE